MQHWVQIPEQSLELEVYPSTPEAVKEARPEINPKSEAHKQMLYRLLHEADDDLDRIRWYFIQKKHVWEVMRCVCMFNDLSQWVTALMKHKSSPLYDPPLALQ